MFETCDLYITDTKSTVALCGAAQKELKKGYNAKKVTAFTLEVQSKS